MRTFLVLLTLFFALNSQAQKRTPNIVIIFIDDMGYADIGPFGAKGLGEGGIVSAAPSVANALFQATGVRIKDLPLTPERVWRAIRDAKE